MDVDESVGTGARTESQPAAAAKVKQEQEPASARVRRAEADARRWREEACRSRYIVDMLRAQQAWQEGWAERVRELLDGQRPEAGDHDFRGFEWYYLWRLSHSDRLTFRGHRAQVYGLAYSPDGRHLGSAESAGWPGVKVWNAATGQVLLAFGPHAVNNVAYSPDGRYLATASSNQGVTIWDAATGHQVPTVSRSPLPAFGVAYSPDGKRLAACGMDGMVKVWEAATGRELLSLKREPAFSVVFSPDGRLLASAETRAVRVWEAATGKDVHTFQGQDLFQSVAFSPDGKCLAAGSSATNQPGGVTVWELATGKERFRQGHGKEVLSVAFSPDGTLLASASADRTVKAWWAATGVEAFSLKGHADGVTRVVFSPDGKSLASAGLDHTVKVWDVAAGQGPPSLLVAGGAFTVAFSPDGRLLASGGHEGTVTLWEMATRKEVSTLRGHSGNVASVAFSPDGRRLASAGGDVQKPGEVKVYEVLTGQEAFCLPEAARVATSVAYSPDGEHLASTDLTGTVRVWNLPAGRQVFTIPGVFPSRSIAFSPDGRDLATTSAPARLWEVATGKERRAFRGDATWTHVLAFSPSGSRLATTGADRTVKVWDPATGQLVLTLKGHTSFVECVTFSPDGQRLATAGGDHTVRLWEAATGQEICALPAGAGGWDRVTCLAFSPDGRLLVVVDNGTLKLCEGPPPSPDRAEPQACQVAGRVHAGRTPLGKIAPQELEALWGDLAGADAPRAYQALWRLVAAPRQTVPFLAERLRAVPPRADLRLAPMLAGLDSDNFQTREKATRELEVLGDLVESDLRRVLAGTPSLEVRRRLQDLLAKLGPGKSPQRLRVLRAVEVLEHIDTVAAAEVLRTLAKGAPQARLTQEARATLKRLTKRSASSSATAECGRARP
jgi:WD40 repeat protein